MIFRASLCIVGQKYPDLIAFATMDLSPETPLITAYCLALILIARASFLSVGRVPFMSTFTRTCLVRLVKLVDAILLRAYWIILSSFAMYEPLIWFATKQESTFADRFVRMSPALDPSKHDDPSVKRVLGSGIASSTCISTGGSSSFGLSAMKSARIWLRMDVLGLLLEACTSVSTSFSIELLFISGAYKVRLTKQTCICWDSLSISKTALMASLAAHRYTISSSLGLGAVTIGSSIMHCFKSWNALSASGVH
ncbi:hypothetical protein Tco_1311800 [Tanacetum coccineum]